jgi:uncharacterized protein (DUF488 family)
MLITNNITTLVDVRKNPISMKFGFSKGKLSEYIARVGLSYRHLPELGIASNLRQELNTLEDRHQLFEYYSTTILPSQKAVLEELQLIITKEKRVALTCFEHNPHHCHRFTLVEYMQNKMANSSNFLLPTVTHLRQEAVGTVANSNKLRQEELQLELVLA